jgi:dihydroflavonol-4-reductase
VVEKLCKLIGLTPPFTYDLVYEVAERYAWYDTSATTKDLQISPRKASESLQSAIEWLLKTNRIKPSLSDKIAQQLKRYQG